MMRAMYVPTYHTEQPPPSLMPERSRKRRRRDQTCVSHTVKRRRNAKSLAYLSALLVEEA
jgi:hypothetical protein